MCRVRDASVLCDPTYRTFNRVPVHSTDLTVCWLMLELHELCVRRSACSTFFKGGWRGERVGREGVDRLGGEMVVVGGGSLGVWWRRLGLWFWGFGEGG